jgi:hypothetical protein
MKCLINNFANDIREQPQFIPIHSVHSRIKFILFRGNPETRLRRSWVPNEAPTVKSVFKIEINEMITIENIGCQYVLSRAR